MKCYELLIDDLKVRKDKNLKGLFRFVCALIQKGTEVYVFQMVKN